METEASTIDLVAKIGTSLSVLCVIALWTTWYLMPRWRTLHNYIALWNNYTPYLEATYSGAYGSFLLSYLKLNSASALLAYFKLVILNNGTVSYEKTSVTIFVFGLTGYVKLICQCIVRKMCSLDIEEASDLELFSMSLIISLIVMLFIRIVVSVMSCFKKSASKRNARHVLAMIGVAIVCDTGTMIWMFLVMFFDNDGMGIWFCFRLIPHTLFILFNSSSMLHWKWYMQKRKRAAVVV